MLKEKVIQKIKELVQSDYIELTTRGNTAIEAALSILPKNKQVLIPEEGAWIHYRKAPGKLGLGFAEVKCDEAKINLTDLKQKLISGKGCYGAFLYQNPGGYFAEQPQKEIYELCKKQGCLVILDVSGSIGTDLCNQKYADILVCSFGKWKLVEAHIGGFISCQEQSLFSQLKRNSVEKTVLDLKDESLKIILKQLSGLKQRIEFLLKLRKTIISYLIKLGLKPNLVYPNDLGFVVVVKFNKEKEKQEIEKYCKSQGWPYCECPREIRINRKALSIEVKQLQEKQLQDNK